MRSAGARAAALLLTLALTLGAAGCILIDSTSPLWVGTQDYDSGNENVNGNWVGKTGSGGDVTFQIGSDTVSNLLLVHLAPGCTLPFEALTTEDRVVDNVFTVEIILDQGRFVVTGRFTGAGTATGTYFFEALQAGVCPSAGTGTFSAAKTLL